MAATLISEKKILVKDLPSSLQEEIQVNFSKNGNVGEVLIFENDQIRIWDINIKPGVRLPFHHHQLNYFYIPMTKGSALSHWYEAKDNSVTAKVFTYEENDTTFMNFEKGQYLFHDLTNTGTKALRFITVEMKTGSKNSPLPIT